MREEQYYCNCSSNIITLANQSSKTSLQGLYRRYRSLQNEFPKVHVNQSNISKKCISVSYFFGNLIFFFFFMKSIVFTPDICTVSLILCDVPSVCISYFYFPPPTIVLAHTLCTIFIPESQKREQVLLHLFRSLKTFTPAKSPFSVSELPLLAPALALSQPKRQPNKAKGKK